MKPIRKIFLSSFVVTALQFGLSGCVSEGYVGTGVYYGPHRDPWFRDEGWMDGNRWYGEPRSEVNLGIYLHPPRRGR